MTISILITVGVSLIWLTISTQRTLRSRTQRSRPPAGKQLIAFLEQSNEFVRIKLIPREIIVEPGVTAIELDCIMHAEKDLPDFLLGPMEKGGEAKMLQAAVYRLTQDRISQARVYWSRQVK